ncbi:hypothetical protein LSCM1_05004 [Leishmania martiniquensis]|uniref:Uncharacterized protein n=1 Tax=Leishmania martiniquensis TaxID=1580590 RepID=A0A836HA33_9TRYP|nr:hypothetical protein LSCM1_05004 [Leishmania martiniquensis]
MDSDLFLLIETATAGIFGVVLLTLIGIGIFACVQRARRVKKREQECADLLAMLTEKQQQLQWLTGIRDITDNSDLFNDLDLSSAWSSRG